MKVAVVTGGSSGIGLGICKALKERYGDTYEVINASRTQRDNDFSTFHKTDVSKYDDIVALFNHIKDKYKMIDLLVNNAGVMPFGELEEITEEYYNRVMNTNFKGPVFMCKYALKMMKIQDWQSNIINIASVSGIRGKDLPVYSASKAALISLTKILAYQYAPRIRTNCISPGFIKTNLVLEDTPKELVMEVPLKFEGEPKNVADLVIHILDNNYINGANFVVDGGVSL